MRRKRTKNIKQKTYNVSRDKQKTQKPTSFNI